MKKLVIDSNIIFASLISSNSKTRTFLLNSGFQFYCPNFLIVEIFKYQKTILEKSKESEEVTFDFLTKILTKITFVNEDNISISNFVKAYKICKNFDEKDTPFVALAYELDLPFWTRDKKLKDALQEEKFKVFELDNNS